jgi:hypothetical protein
VAARLTCRHTSRVAVLPLRTAVVFGVPAGLVMTSRTCKRHGWGLHYLDAPPRKLKGGRVGPLWRCEMCHQPAQPLDAAHYQEAISLRQAG